MRYFEIVQVQWSEEKRQTPLAKSLLMGGTGEERESLHFAVMSEKG